jgi:hypothetical protein
MVIVIRPLSVGGDQGVGWLGSQDAENVVLAGERPQPCALQLTATLTPSTMSAPTGTALVSTVCGSTAPALS